MKTLLFFHGDSCGACKMMEPSVKELEKEFKVMHVNTSENEGMELARKFMVRNIPTFIAVEGDVIPLNTKGSIAGTASKIALRKLME